MKKVKITKEQAEAIERWSDKEQLIIAKVLGLLEHGKDEPIYTLTTKELVQAVYIGYEVEPEFRVGDEVIYRFYDNVLVIGEIVKFETEDGRIYAVINDPEYPVAQKVVLSKLKHATPSEIKRYLFRKTTRDEVKWFANLMNRRMEENKHKDEIGWKHWKLDDFLIKIEEKVEEINRQGNAEQYQKIINECVNIANYVMMLADNMAKKYK